MPGSRLTTYQAGRVKITQRARTGRPARGGTRIVIEANAPDPTAVSLAVQEWIVPVLVREFLAERTAKTTLPPTVNMQKLDTGPIGKEQQEALQQTND